MGRPNGNNVCDGCSVLGVQITDPRRNRQIMKEIYKLSKELSELKETVSKYDRDDDPLICDGSIASKYHRLSYNCQRLRQVV
jgi:hypothetical protein